MPKDNPALSDYSFLQYVCREKRGLPPQSSAPGSDAYQQSIEAAMRGERHPTQVSNLRGTLRKVILQLAVDIKAAENEPKEMVRLQKKVDAMKRVLTALHGYKVVSEEQDGNVVWRRKLAG